MNIGYAKSCKTDWNLNERMPQLELSDCNCRKGKNLSYESKLELIPPYTVNKIFFLFIQLIIKSCKIKAS